MGRQREVSVSGRVDRGITGGTDVEGGVREREIEVVINRLCIGVADNVLQIP